jgi:hypothetical protein
MDPMEVTEKTCNFLICCWLFLQGYSCSFHAFYINIIFFLIITFPSLGMFFIQHIFICMETTRKLAAIRPTKGKFLALENRSKQRIINYVI